MHYTKLPIRVASIEEYCGFDMTTQREHRKADRLVDSEYPKVSKLPSHKRLKSVDEMDIQPRIRGLSQTRSKPAHRFRPQNLARNALILVTLFFVALAVSVEISCHISGDPNPSQDWRVGYDLTPMIDANDIENCRINTFDHWKARSIDRIKILL